MRRSDRDSTRLHAPPVPTPWSWPIHHVMHPPNRRHGPPRADRRTLPAQQNLDFEPGRCSLTRYNAAASALPLLEQQAAGAPPPRADHIEQLNPYSNTCGVLALPRSDAELLRRYGEAVARAASAEAPAFD